MQRYPSFPSAEAQRLRDTRVLQRLLETETEAVERRADAARRARKYRKAKLDRKTNEAAYFGLTDNDSCRFCDSFHLAAKEPEITNDLGQEIDGHFSEICSFPGCNKAVNCREDWESHRVTHRTMSARDNRIQCSICRRKFSIRTLFEEHLASHTGEVRLEMTKTEDVTWKELDESYILPDKLQTDQLQLIVPKTEPLDEPEESPQDVELAILQPKVELEEEPEEELIVDVVSNGSESEGPTPSKRKNYDLKFKLDVVAYAEKHSKKKAAKDKKVNRKQVQEWTKQKTQLEDQLKATPSSSKAPSKRIQGAGRPLKDKRFDGKLIDWVRQQRREKLRVSRTIIQKQALAFSTAEDFKASNGWLEKFLHRHNLICRRPTNVRPMAPEKCADKVVECFSDAGNDSDSDVSVDFQAV